LATSLQRQPGPFLGRHEKRATFDDKAGDGIAGSLRRRMMNVIALVRRFQLRKPRYSHGLQPAAPAWE
jgi:hypothetical protein